MQHQALEVRQVLGQQGIGGQQQVVVLQVVKMLATANALQGQDAQTGSEACRFVLPIGDQAGRHHHHGRAGQASGILFREQVSKRLQGLAQAHVVGEDAAHFQFAQGLHPAQAFKLIGTQGGVETVRCVCRLLADVAQAFSQVAHAVAALPAQWQLLQGIEACGVGGGQAQAGFTGLALIEIAEGGQHRFQSPVGQGNLQRTAAAGVAGNRHQKLLVLATLGQLRTVEQFRMST
ncbi:hypothetical protein D3C84_784860 [compost metagenome]